MSVRMWRRLVLCALTVGACEAEPYDEEPNTVASEIAPIERELHLAADQAQPEYILGDLCNRKFTLEYDVPVGDGTRLHILERFSGRSVFRRDRRAALLIPGTLVTGPLMWDIDVQDGEFSTLDRLADEGYFALAVTYEGYGDSTLPEDGSTVTAERTLDQLAHVVERIRLSRRVHEVDLFGASLGASLAVALGGEMNPIDSDAVGRIVLQAHVYKSVTPLFEAVFFNPEVRAMLENAPGGYIPTAPEMYGLIVAAADPAAAQFAFENYPGIYATGPTLEGFDLPVFDGTYGRAPALQAWGDQDPITPFADVEQFQAEYAGDLTVEVIPGSGHAPYIGLPAAREQFWDATMEHLEADRPNRRSICDHWP